MLRFLISSDHQYICSIRLSEPVETLVASDQFPRIVFDFEDTAGQNILVEVFVVFPFIIRKQQQKRPFRGAWKPGVVTDTQGQPAVLGPVKDVVDELESLALDSSPINIQ